jgi:hypothetical protein
LQDIAYSVAAFSNSTSFLESTVNELFKDAHDQPKDQRFAGISGSRVSDLARYVNNRSAWNGFKNAKNAAYKLAGTYGNEILIKFQFAARSLGFAEMNESEPEFSMIG